MNSLSLFHFLRPEWFWAAPFMLVLWWQIRQRTKDPTPAGPLMAPHLRDALTINQNRTRSVQAVDGVTVMVLVLVVAAAGPTWSKAPSPWFSETAPLVVAIEVTDSMRANDLQPTRLDRARFKLLDLIALRTGSRTAVLAYAGSAHVVVPPSTDIDVIKPLLESLDPSIMPVTGSQASTVLEPAMALLGDNAAIGTLLFVNDGFDALDVPALAAFTERTDAPAVAALIAGTEAGGVALLPDGSPVMAGGSRLDTAVDEAILSRIEREAGIPLTRISTGDEDLRSVLRAIASNLAAAEDPDARWQDEGWWFLWPAALLMLLWFRRGWTMRW